MTNNKQDAIDPQDLTLLKAPLKTLYYFSLVVTDKIKQVFSFIFKHIIIFGIIITLIVTPVVVKGSHTPLVEQTEEILKFMAYWIVLGIASSIGLGTGLHTFVLYLGPWIAKVTLVAEECQTIPRMIPNKWSFQTFDDCPENVANPIGFWEILLSVQFQAFLWGLGTAIGELPPYFIAKAARQSKKKIEELDDVEKHKDDKDLQSRLQRLIFNNLQKHGFITVLLCASVPNPLFDLAGITCGHFGIPFAIFFSATAIGQAIIKTHIQMVFVIFVFSKHHVQSLLGLVEAWFPFLHGNLSKMLEQQQQLLHTPHVNESDAPIYKVIWEYFILAMIIFFLASTVQSLAQNKLSDLQQETDNNSDKQKIENQTQEKKQTPKDQKQNQRE